MTWVTRNISLVNMILGLWMIIAPILIYKPSQAMTINAVVVGILIFLLSAVNVYRTMIANKEVEPKISNIIILLAVWLAISPLIFFNFGTTDVGMVYNPIVVGFLIVLPEAYNYFVGEDQGRGDLINRKTTI